MDPADQSSAAAFAFAHERCALIRNASFVQALTRARANGIIRSGVALTPISPQALREYGAQWTAAHWTGAGGWQWNVLARRFTRKPRSFHAALWSGSRLCGLCVGRLSKGRKHLTLHYMESAPDPAHPLRGVVTLLMFEAARNYGTAMGADKLLLREPLPGVVARYENFGFRLAQGAYGLVYFERILD